MNAASPPSSADLEHLRRAIALAAAGIGQGGGPFGAIVAREDEVLGEGTNLVVSSRDPTAHAEIVALRAASSRLGTHVLAGCVLYSSCEPCPMCLGAAWWARVDRIVVAASREDAALAGFDDAVLFDEVARPLGQRVLPVTRALADEGAAVLRAWASDPRRIPY